MPFCHAAKGDTSRPPALASLRLSGPCMCLHGLQVGMYATGRIIAAVARSHLLPPFLARVHHKLGTPYIATLLSGVATAVMALFTGRYHCIISMSHTVDLD